MWRQEDLYHAALGGRGTPSQGVAPTVVPTDVVDRATGNDPIRRRLPFCPLFHGGALWVVLQSLLSGGTAIVSTDRHHDGVAACDLLASERAELTMVIGDAVARPIADALAAHPSRWDLASLRVVASGGALLSPAVAAALGELLPGVKVVDTFGASETGGQGRLARRPAGGPPRLLSDDETAVLGDDLRPVGPGSVGRLARRGRIPLGYWGDEVKTAATFPTVDGVRWSVPGDLARREHDGTITLLGRGSTSINTGGEKVFPEEVEGVVRSHPAVLDALVVGVDDDRFGQRVVAVLSLRPDVDDPGDEALSAHCRTHLAGYKVPRTWVRVEHCQRLPTGKPDYAWARSTAGGPVRRGG
jgi:acyl-CoA synthetase (AMP-forming)/AMP-acid ligase II